MRLEREFLCAENHVRWHATFSEQIRSNEGTLQTKRLFGVPSAGIVDRDANTADCLLARRCAGNSPTLDH